MNPSVAASAKRAPCLAAGLFLDRSRSPIPPSNGSMPLIPLLLQSLFLVAALASVDAYHERLLLQPLAPASLLASFNFRSNASVTSFERQHFGNFPRSLGQILQHARTKELHLRFSAGRWDAESWGARPWDGAKEGGTGVEIWAWVEADTDEEYVPDAAQ